MKSAPPPPETFRVTSRRVTCDGAGEIPGGATLGHPRVFLEIDEAGFVDCGYCDRRFVLAGGPATARRLRATERIRVSLVDELAAQLKAAYFGAPKGKQVLSLHLFAIEHAQALKTLDKLALLSRAGLSDRYRTELNKAINLADHVKITNPIA